jgi:beta-glucosidase
VLHGTDVECGTNAYHSLVQAVQQGKITEAQIDISVKKLFLVRFQLGLFDPPAMVPYAETTASVLESAPHKEHALKMARQSLVLLRNEGNVLPLKKNLKKIAVVGPNADNAIAVLGNYNGTPSQIVTALQGIKAKVGSGVEVVYEKGVNFTNDSLLRFEDIGNQYALEGKKGFKAEYFSNRELKGTPLETRMEPGVDNFWQEGQIVTGTLKAYDFSARYTTDFTPTTTGEITFDVEGDDGYRFLVNGKEELNAWTRNRWGSKQYTLRTEKGKTYRLVLEYYQGEGKASISLKAGHFYQSDLMALANRLKDADAIVYVGGISPQLEGEEMKVDYPGFNGGDRTSILLPKVQTDLMKALKTTGKPLVFVMMTGSAIAVPWEAKNVPAILNAWYGGQAAGTAIADVLFGDYNPAGRLPVTFYAGDQDLADFQDYSMENRTYRYFKGEPLFGFGYGLSYTSFKYENLKVPTTYQSGAEAKVSVKVRNTGKLDGEEVVQLYVTNQSQGVKAALKALKGFQRITLKAGESKVVEFNLPADTFITVNADGKGTVQPGKFQVSVGGAQPGTKAPLRSNSVQAVVTVR